MFLIVDTHDPTAITLVIACALGVIYPLMYAPEASFFAALFPTAVRYTGLSISAHVGGAVGGGLAPIVAASLLASYGNAMPVGIYLGGLACLSFLCVLLLKPPKEAVSP
jgi:MHS family shikimate/dehydroshikimate transporter-like MFS transporter